MKIKSLILAGVFAIAGFNASANNSSLFSYNKSDVNSKLNCVTAVENFVNQNEGVTIANLNADGQQLVAAANLTEATSISASLLDGPVGIPSFVWGLCLSVTGILVVYLVTQDGDETKKALFGCLLGGVVYGVFYVIYVIAVIGSF